MHGHAGGHPIVAAMASRGLRRCAVHRPGGSGGALALF